MLLETSAPINVAVIGSGAFGRNHARVYQQLAQQGAPVRLVGVVDRDLARADAVAREFGCRSFGSVDQLITTHSEVQAASVAVPTVQHFEVAKVLLEAGVDVLVEKPLATSLKEASELVEPCRTPQASCSSRPPGALQSGRTGDCTAGHAAHVL